MADFVLDIKLARGQEVLIHGAATDSRTGAGERACSAVGPARGLRADPLRAGAEAARPQPR